MDLFDDASGPLSLLEPPDEAFYFGPRLNRSEADDYMQRLRSALNWSPDELVIYGQKRQTRRLIAWHADRDYAYGYSNTKRIARPWSEDLLELKAWVEDETQETYNACLLNYYPEGDVGMAWHSDAERELKKHGAIASLSLGAARRFLFRHKRSRETRELVLEHGSLLLMRGTTQENWLHSLPATQKATGPRINLTFRTIVVDGINGAV